MSVDYCTVEDALLVVERLGVQVGDFGLLSSALERPRTDIFGVEAYPNLHLKAAALVDAIKRAHALDDGNKRLSWVLTVLFYELNGYNLYVSADDGEAFVLEIAGSHRELDAIAEWLKAHTHVLT